jgi:two-component system phosphate regulon sensor histidine kinase PhoR
MNVLLARMAILLSLLFLGIGGVYLVVGPVVALTVLVVLLVVVLAYYVYQAQRLWRLLDAPAYGEIPSALGMWGEVYYRLHRLVKRWRMQVLEVEQQHLRFIQAMQASPNGVLMLDDHDQIEWCNAVAEAHFGLDAKRDTRQRITHLVRHPSFIKYMSLQHFDEPLIIRDAGLYKQNVIEIEVFPYGERRKLLLSHDITKLENTEAMRRDFVANVSHELKTPLTVLNGFLETVRDLPLSPEDRARYLELMHSQAHRMQHIVEDLLALAKLEGDSEVPPLERVPMTRVMQQLQHDAEALSGGRHTIRVLSSPNVDVLGAEIELLSAFGNLVSNAVRYTPKGEQVTLHLRHEGGRAVFEVSDTGLGIDAEHIPRLTERFYRVDRSRSRDTGGTGLGLAIVKHVVSRHQGEFEVRSEVGRGSQFIIRFPVERSVIRASGSPQVAA